MLARVVPNIVIKARGRGFNPIIFPEIKAASGPSGWGNTSTMNVIKKTAIYPYILIIWSISDSILLRNIMANKKIKRAKKVIVPMMYKSLDFFIE